MRFAQAKRNILDNGMTQKNLQNNIQINPVSGRSVFNALWRLVDGALAEASNSQVRCLRAVPRIDGTLYFDLKTPQGSQTINWIGPKPDLSFAGDTKYDQDILQKITKILDDIQHNQLFSLIHYKNQDIDRISFDDQVVDFLLAGRLAPNLTSWYQYRFIDAFQESSQRFQLTFSDGKTPVVFLIQAAGTNDKDESRLIRNSIFSLDIVEDGRAETDKTHIFQQVERFVGFFLSRAIHPGMTLDQASLIQGQDDTPVSSSRYEKATSWCQFFSDFEIERSNLCSMRFVDPSFCLVHGEPECRWIEPDLGPRTVAYANLPWIVTKQDNIIRSSGNCTNLSEKEAIFGGLDRFEAAMQEAVSNQEVDFIWVNNTCLPKVIGDDIESTIKRFSKKSPCPIFSLNTDKDSPDQAFFDLVKQINKKTDIKDPPERSGLNLVGFPPTRGRDEIIATLTKMQIDINAMVLPDIGIDLLNRYKQGKASIVYPQEKWLTLINTVMQDWQVDWQAPPAPYGLKRTAEWYQKIAEVCDRSPQSSSWPDYQQKWQDLSAQAKSHTLAFVIAGISVDRFVEAQYFYGVEVLSLLQEMGFKLAILFYGDLESRKADIEKINSSLGHDRVNIDFQYFSSPEELGQLLANPALSAIYSEVFFDRRVTKSGKPGFNLSLFEMGFAGALRSLAKLLKICNWNFYSDYVDYIEPRK
jgi:hypothetical protein